jgi:hypothetical protein
MSDGAAECGDSIVDSRISGPGTWDGQSPLRVEDTYMDRETKERLEALSADLES